MRSPSGRELSTHSMTSHAASGAAAPSLVPVNRAPSAATPGLVTTATITPYETRKLPMRGPAGTRKAPIVASVAPRTSSTR